MESESEAGMNQTTAGGWAVEIDGGMLIPCDSEAEAVEHWEIGEYELGFSVVVFRPEVNNNVQS